MSFQYDQYLARHRANVKRGFDWLSENLPGLMTNTLTAGWNTEFAHDQSKNEPNEYEAYDAYFYGNNRSYEVVHNYKHGKHSCKQRCTGRACHTKMKPPYKPDIQHNIYNIRTNRDLHRKTAVLLCSQNTGTVIVQCNKWIGDGRKEKVLLCICHHVLFDFSEDQPQNLAIK